ncbi:hypothetical protein Brsp04_04015 [Brucella sp. NBRC 12952]|uniref:Uncharacterized protein n=1 Tax=Brucella pseudogrignonensis TaxID=419475 RepID=A0A7Y3WYB6_9HYPH|nr:hypothetical protein [Brucella pseudogrignonensis]NNV23380.1 hypothetical protein [Brucella pseudogrignonensis]
MARDLFADKTAGARLRGAIKPVDCDPTPRSIEPHDNNASSHGSSLRAWGARDKRPVSRQAPLREGPAYLIWWLMIAAGIIGYLLVSWVWQ